MYAFIFINTERGKHWKVLDTVLETEGVKFGHAVTGEYDVIAYAEFIKMTDLGFIIDKIQSVEGVVRTITAIAMATRLNDSPF